MVYTETTKKAEAGGAFMYKIMLVEDETAMLRAMTDIIDWPAMAFYPPVACENGREAIKAIEDGFAPDAVITDICMPFTDGIALTEYLAEHCPKTLVVLLTGYDDFSYAHKALKLRVFDYVLKPITPKSLRQLAQRLYDELEDRRIRDVDSFDSLTRKRFFTGLLTSRLDPKTVQDSLRVYKLEAAGPWWRAAAVSVDLPPATTAEQSRDNELTLFGLNNIVEELAHGLCSTVECVYIKEAVCVVLCGATPEALLEDARALSGRVEEGCRLLGKHATCGVGLAVQAPYELYNSYSQALLALHYRFFAGAVPLILGEEIDMQSTAEFNYSDYAQKFFAALKEMDRERTLEAVDEMFRQMQSRKLAYPMCLRYCQRMGLDLLDRLSDYLTGEEMDKLEKAWEKANFFSASTLDQLHGMLNDLCALFFDSLAQVGADNATVRMRQAEAYIREHYSDEELSLNTMRDVFSISISYFSATFKAVTGNTFVEYLTQVRIEKAKELLKFTDKRTAEIASEVGFADPHYFSITFKRVTGCTPREYRTRQRPAAV